MIRVNFAIAFRTQYVPSDHNHWQDDFCWIPPLLSTSSCTCVDRHRRQKVITRNNKVLEKTTNEFSENGVQQGTLKAVFHCSRLARAGEHVSTFANNRWHSNLSVFCLLLCARTRLEVELHLTFLACPRDWFFMGLKSVAQPELAKKPRRCEFHSRSRQGKFRCFSFAASDTQWVWIYSFSCHWGWLKNSLVDLPSNKNSHRVILKLSSMFSWYTTSRIRWSDIRITKTIQ